MTRLVASVCAFVLVCCVARSSALFRVLDDNPGDPESLGTFEERLKDSEDKEIEIRLYTTYPGRDKRSSDDLPDDLDIAFPAGSHTARLHLHRNPRVGARVPVTVERRGQIIYQNLPQSHTVGYYQDVAMESAFMVETNHDGNGQQYSFFGEIIQDNMTYLVQPPDGTHPNHTITEIQEERPAVNDFVMPPDTATVRQTDGEPLGRQSGGRNRRETILYGVEVLIVADYKIYSYWFDRSTAATTVAKDQDAKGKIEQYYAFVINAIDLRYKSVTGRDYTIDILFAGLHIADTPEGAPWTETFKNTSYTPTQVGALEGLVAFQEWVVSQSSLPGFDHAMLFTGYDMTRNGSNGVLGLAYVGYLCSSHRVSINEFSPAASMATIAAHELGHNLGAYHDSDGNNCSEHAYIMGAILQTSHDDPAYNRIKHWIFSSCTLDYFDNNVGSFACLTSLSGSYDLDALTAYADDLAGQIYPPDVQCQEAVAVDSFFYRSNYEGNFSTICSKFHCASPGNNGYYRTAIAWDGTTCGNGKLCLGGDCVTSAAAPTGLTETCLFGDQPLPVWETNNTCSNHTGRDCYFYDTYCCATCGAIEPQYAGLTDCQYGDHYTECSSISISVCYQYETECCGTCLPQKSSVTGCEYGDRESWCSAADCEGYSPENRTVTCCASCNSTTTSTISTTTTTPTTTTPTTTTPTTTTTTPTTTTTTPTTTTTTPTKTTTTTPTTATTTTKPTATTPTTTTTEPITTTTTTTTTTTETTTTTTKPTTTTTPPTTTTTTPTITTTTPTPTTTAPTYTTTPPTTTTTTPTTTTPFVVPEGPTLGETCAIDAECTTVANAICGSDTSKVCECDAANGYIVNAGTCEKSGAASIVSGVVIIGVCGLVSLLFHL